MDLVAAYLDSEGIAATVAPRPTRLSDLDDLAPDIAIPGVALTVTSRLRHRLSDDLDGATRTAVIVGAPVGALVQWRADRDISQSYAVLPLSALVRLASQT